MATSPIHGATPTVAVPTTATDAAPSAHAVRRPPLPPRASLRRRARARRRRVPVPLLLHGHRLAADGARPHVAGAFPNPANITGDNYVNINARMNLSRGC